MLRCIIILPWLEILNAATEQVTTEQVYNPLWRYDDESRWPGLRCKVGGRRQSPIDIKTDLVIEDFNELYIKYGPLMFTGYEGVLLTGSNNGHTIQFTTEGEEEMHPCIRGGPLDRRYRLEQLHFHWLSEHAINGVKYPMEIHFVHVRTGMNVFDALSRRDGLAIVAVFCSVISDQEDAPENVKQLMSYVPRLSNTGDRISGAYLDLTKWLSPNQKRYYTYSGSLTSPKCNEAVTWIVFETPISVTNIQYQSLCKVGFGGPNSRSLQKLSKHTVYMPPKTKIRMPMFYTYYKDFYINATKLLKNITNTLMTSIRNQDKIF